MFSETGLAPPARPVVCVVEDDEATRKSISSMLNDHGYRCREFPTAEAYLASGEGNRPSCLVLDYQLPGISGLDLLVRLRDAGNAVPTVVTTGHIDVPQAVRFMERGAVTLLEKPFRGEELSTAISKAICQDEVDSKMRAWYEKISESVEQLSPREKTVLQAIVEGQLNKAIARSLDVSVRTIEGDRAKIVAKFGAETTGEVVGKFAQFNLLTELGYAKGEANARPGV